MILASHGIIDSISGVDADWLAFYNRVIANNGSLTVTEQNATKQLVADLKFYGIWNKISAAYPFVGGSKESCAINLKSASFTSTFTSTGIVYASTGIKGNGISGYMDTNFVFNASSYYDVNDFHMGHYSRSNILTPVMVDMGNGKSISSTAYYSNLFQYLNSSVGAGGSHYNRDLSVTTANSQGLVLKSVTANNVYKLYKNGSLLQTVATVQGTSPDLNINCRVLSQDSAFSTRECAFATLGFGLTDTQAANYYTAIQAFQTTLSRQV